MNLYRVMAVFAVVLMASGCSTSSLPENPAEGYSQLADKRDNGKYHVEYELTTEVSNAPSSSFNIQADFYQFNSKQKVVGDSPSSFRSTTATYKINNSTVTCYERSSSVSCSTGGTENLFSFISNPKFSNFSYNGSGEFAGRKCKMFNVEPNMSIISSSSYNYTNMNVCVDRKQGFISFTQINISDDDTSATLTIEAESFDREVTKGDVELPKTLSVSSSCYSNPSISITALKPIDSAEISLNGENRTISLGDRFEEKEFELNESRIREGSNDLKIHYKGKTVKENCYFTNYSIGDPYDPNYPSGVEKSNLDLSQYTLVEDRVRNGDFTDTSSSDTFRIDGWNYTNGNTRELSRKNLLDGKSVGTSWKGNSLNADPVSVFQEVNLTGINAVGIDVAGGNGNPYRSKIILEVDGEKQGRFIRSPQPNEEYHDLGVKLDEDFKGLQTLKIKWVQVKGDNLGSSAIDNVKVYR